MRFGYRVLGSLSIAAFAAGCAGSQSHLRLLEAGGNVQVTSVSAEDHDYLVAIRNTVDFGHNPDDKPTRDRLARQFLEVQCPRGQIVGEDVIATGTYLGGRPSRIYQIRVKCDPAA